MATYRMTLTATPGRAGYMRAVLELGGIEVHVEGYTITAYLQEDIMQSIMETIPTLLGRGYIVSPPAIERLTRKDTTMTTNTHVDQELLNTFRTYLPKGATVYSLDVNPNAVRNYWAFYCACDGKIMHLSGMITNLLQQLGHTSVKFDHGNWKRRMALVTDMSLYDHEIVRILANQLYNDPNALRHADL